MDGSIVVGKIQENKSATFGFNAQTEEYGDMVAQGVIGPAKVVRIALQDAASVAFRKLLIEEVVPALARVAPGSFRTAGLRLRRSVTDDAASAL